MSEKIEIQLGKRIKELREKAHLTQAELAQLSMKSIETISNFERGKTIPSVRTLAGLASLLGCNIADFFKSTKIPDRNGVHNVTQMKLKLLDLKDRDLVNDFVELLMKRNRR